MKLDMNEIVGFAGFFVAQISLVATIVIAIKILLSLTVE